MGSIRTGLGRRSPRPPRWPRTSSCSSTFRRSTAWVWLIACGLGPLPCSSSPRRSAAHRIPAITLLLASILEYPIDAAVFARELSPGDAVRLYVLEDKDHLREAAERAEGSDRLAQYLALLQLAERGDAEARTRWTRWKDTHFFSPGPSLPVLRASWNRPRHIRHAHVVRRIARRDLHGKGRTTDADAAEGQRRRRQRPDGDHAIELSSNGSEVTSRQPQTRSANSSQAWRSWLPIRRAPSGAQRKRRRSGGRIFTRGLHCLTTFTLDWLDSPEGSSRARKVLRSCSGRLRLPISTVVPGARRGAVRHPAGRPGFPRPPVVLEATLGAPLLSRSLQEIPEFVAWHLRNEASARETPVRPPRQPSFAPRAPRRGGSRDPPRPQPDRVALCRNVPGRARRVVRLAVGVRAVERRFLGTLRVARDSSRSIRTGAHALRQLQTVAPEREVRAGFEELFRADHFGTSSGYFYFERLDGLERWKEGLSVCDRWLAHHGKEEGLIYVQLGRPPRPHALEARKGSRSVRRRRARRGELAGAR